MRHGLEPGSYVLIFRAKGRAQVTAPVRLMRGERYSLNLELPEASSVPRITSRTPAASVAVGWVFYHAVESRFLSAPPLLRKPRMSVAMALAPA